jgi:hypothetical protein
VLTLIGKVRLAKGIIEVAEMPAPSRRSRRRRRRDARRCQRRDDDGCAPARSGDHVSLRRRVWPMVEMMKRAQAGNEPIVWGV